MRPLPKFSAHTHPQLVAADTLRGSDHVTIGTAFGWLLRLRLVDQPSLVEAQSARDLLPPHVRMALRELDGWVADGQHLCEPRDLERVAIVLAWCEQLYRAGPAALPPCPLLRLGAMVQPSFSTSPLIRWRASSSTSAPRRRQAPRRVPLNPQRAARLPSWPLGADADLVLDGVLLELKCTQVRPARRAGHSPSASAWSASRSGTWGAVKEAVSAPRGAVCSDGGGRPPSPGRRSGWVKLEAA